MRGSVPTSGGVVSTDSLQAAQEKVPFPVFAPPDRPLSITVRRGTRWRWPTVRTTHRVGSVFYSMKQYSMDYFGHFSAPNKLYTTKPETWAPYAPVTELDVGFGSAFHGSEWDGVEGGSLVAYATHIEIRVRKGSLGPMKMEQVFRGLAPPNNADALDRASRPLQAWNWSVSGRRIPRSPSNEGTVGLVWAPWGESRARSAVAGIGPTAIEGWRLDTIALRPRASQRIVRTLWRSADLNSVMETVRVPPTRPGLTRPWPLPPLFNVPSSPQADVRGIRSSTLRWAYYEVSRLTGGLRVVIPPGWSEPRRDRRILRKLTASIGKDWAEPPG